MHLLKSGPGVWSPSHLHTMNRANAAPSGIGSCLQLTSSDCLANKTQVGYTSLFSNVNGTFTCRSRHYYHAFNLIFSTPALIKCSACLSMGTNCQGWLPSTGFSTSDSKCLNVSGDLRCQILYTLVDISPWTVTIHIYKTDIRLSIINELLLKKSEYRSSRKQEAFVSSHPFNMFNIFNVLSVGNHDNLLAANAIRNIYAPHTDTWDLVRFATHPQSYIQTSPFPIVLVPMPLPKPKQNTALLFLSHTIGVYICRSGLPLMTGFPRPMAFCLRLWCVTSQMTCCSGYLAHIRAL